MTKPKRPDLLQILRSFLGGCICQWYQGLLGNFFEFTFSKFEQFLFCSLLNSSFFFKPQSAENIKSFKVSKFCKQKFHCKALQNSLYKKIWPFKLSWFYQVCSIFLPLLKFLNHISRYWKSRMGYSFFETFIEGLIIKEIRDYQAKALCLNFHKVIGVFSETCWLQFVSSISQCSKGRICENFPESFLKNNFMKNINGSWTQVLYV